MQSIRSHSVHPYNTCKYSRSQLLDPNSKSYTYESINDSYSTGTGNSLDLHMNPKFVVIISTPDYPRSVFNCITNETRDVSPSNNNVDIDCRIDELPSPGTFSHWCTSNDGASTFVRSEINFIFFLYSIFQPKIVSRPPTPSEIAFTAVYNNNK